MILTFEVKQQVVDTPDEKLIKDFLDRPLFLSAFYLNSIKVESKNSPYPRTLQVKLNAPYQLRHTLINSFEQAKQQDGYVKLKAYRFEAGDYLYPTAMPKISLQRKWYPNVEFTYLSAIKTTLPAVGNPFGMFGSEIFIRNLAITLNLLPRNYKVIYLKNATYQVQALELEIDAVSNGVDAEKVHRYFQSCARDYKDIAFVNFEIQLENKPVNKEEKIKLSRYSVSKDIERHKFGAMQFRPESQGQQLPASETISYVASMPSNAYPNPEKEMAEFTLKPAKGNFKLSTSTNFTIFSGGNAHEDLMRKIQSITVDYPAEYNPLIESLNTKKYEQAVRRICTSKHPSAYYVAKILLEYAQSLNIQINQQAGPQMNAAIHYAARNDDNPNIYMLLLQVGGDQDLRNATGETAIDILKEVAKKFHTLGHTLSN